MEGIANYRGSLESRSDFKESPTGQYRYWMTELEASDKLLRDFKTYGTKIVDRFKGGKRKTNGLNEDIRNGFQLNLFHSNVVTLQSMLYGNLPKVTAKRRYDDPDDDVGRLAAMILERLLNNDIQDNGKEYNSVLRAVLQDRLLPGLGVARVRYSFDPESGLEEAPTDYYHWRDVTWGWSRTFADIPWIGFRAYLNKDEVEARFGKEVADKVKLEAQSTVSDKQEEHRDDDTDSAWKKAEVWEIWDKVNRKVVWISPGYGKILDSKDDPLGLSGFYPCPPFLVANATTTLYVPVSDFYLAQDLYNEIDILQTRISILTEAVKCVGVYNKSADGVSRMFQEGVDNDLIPVDGWAQFAEGGGLKGNIEWVPLDAVTEALTQLEKIRDTTIGLLQQTTGMSDIMRGELGGQYEGVGQSELKAKFGSVRVQALQDEFACFASDLLQLKAEVIGRHFRPETIAKYANLKEILAVDHELVPGAIELIKQPDDAKIRVEVAPESVAMVDYAQLKQERTEYLTALATFMQSSAPLMEQDPNAKPFLLQLLQWGLAGFKGSQQIEGVIDKAIEAAQQEAQNPEQKPDPEMAKMQAQAQLEQAKHQMDMELIQRKTEATMIERKADMDADIKTEQAAAQAKMQQTIADMQADMAIIAAKMKADITIEAQTSEINAMQNANAVQGEMAKDALAARLDVDKMAQQTALKIQEDNLKSANKIKEAKAKPKPGKSDG